MADMNKAPTLSDAQLAPAGLPMLDDGDVAQVTGTISAVAFSFIVQEPSEIIECTSDRSRDSSFRMYRSSSCSA